MAVPAARTSRSSPPYARVKQFLKSGLASGRWAAGDRMPSEAELVARFQVSRMTVNRALRELQQEGLVEREQGVGTFAARLHRVSSTLTLHDVHEEIESRGHLHTATVHIQRAEPAPAEVAVQLDLKLGAPVFHTLIVHHENGVPIQCEDRYVNPACSPEYLDHDFTQRTPTQVLFETTELRSARYTLEAAAARPQEAKLLGIPRDEPCLIVTRLTSARDAVITVGRLVHPGTRYALAGEFAP